MSFILYYSCNVIKNCPKLKASQIQTNTCSMFDAFNSASLHTYGYIKKETNNKHQRFAIVAEMFVITLWYTHPQPQSGFVICYVFHCQMRANFYGTVRFIT